MLLAMAKNYSVKKKISYNSNSALNQNTLKQASLGGGVYNLVELKRKPEYPAINLAHTGFPRYSTRINAKIAFFVLYRSWLFKGFNIKKYQLKINQFYLKLKSFVLKQNLSFNTVVEYAIINILYRVHFIQHIYLIKHILFKKHVILNKIVISNPETIIRVWDLLSVKFSRKY
jgi:hypothetical protein